MNLRHSSPYAFEAVLYASWSWGKIHKSKASNNHCIPVGKARSTMSQSHIFQAQWWLYFLLLWIPHAHVSWQHQAPHGPINLRMISSDYRMQSFNVVWWTCILQKLIRTMIPFNSQQCAVWLTPSIKSWHFTQKKLPWPPVEVCDTQTCIYVRNHKTYIQGHILKGKFR